MRALVLQTSLRGAESASRVLVQSYLTAFLENHPDAQVSVRDLAAEPLPHLSAELVPVQLAMQEGTSPSAVLAEELIAELEQSDIIVVGIAMYNFTIPSTLKAWLDHVIRVKRTFTYGANSEASRPLIPK
ncbi:FMN-dependent NADH-azoreductase [Rhizobium sp. 2YAF20]|uniref:FMN-dependent NADH-azoreductase n=1 Tax=Rhizobium sp. 2YAF20 TaxID=3233027 RepID=UPI003F9B4AB4